MMELEKQPGENWPIAIKCKGALPTGLSLASGTVSAIRLDTNATDNTVLASTTPTISGTDAILRIQAGAAGVDYKITALLLLSDGISLLEEDVLLHVVAR